MSAINAKTLAAAVAGAVAMAAMAVPSHAADTAGKEKCYGIAKAGENGCASQGAGHSCAGQSKMTMSGQDWKLVEAGSCEKMGGKTAAFDNTKPAMMDKKG